MTQYPRKTRNNRQIVKWALKESQDEDGNHWGLHGFAILDFDGPALQIKFVDQNGHTNYQDQAFS